MATGVPFALLAGVQLLSVAAALGLVGAALFPGLRRRSTPLFVTGALLLAVADVLTVVQFGTAASTGLAVLRLAGYLLLAAGFARGVLTPVALSLPPAVLGGIVVVVPLGADVPVSAAQAVAAVLASIAATRARRTDPVRTWLLVAGFGLAAAAAAVGPAARTSGVAGDVLLGLRGAAALLLLAAIGLLTRRSVLAKVVSAILAGVLLMAIGSVGVGSVVAGVVQRQQEDQAQRIVGSQAASVDQLVLEAGTFANVVAVCPQAPDRCAQLLSLFGTLPDDFAAIVRSDGTVQQFGSAAERLSPAEVLDLRGQPVVQAALRGSATVRDGGSTLGVLGGTVTALGVAPAPNTPPGKKPAFAAVYGGRLLDQGFAARAEQATTYDVTLLVGDRAVASSLSANAAAVIVRDARGRVLDDASLAQGDRTVVVPAAGDRPTIAYRALASRDGHRVAVLAVSQAATAALSAERRAFTELFLTALAVMVLISLLGILLGRRVVQPIRRLTVVASQIRRGDLGARTGLRGRDEVGALSRAFDAMTDSVARLTGDLREAADAESALRARLETVLASMSDALVATDDDGVVTSINPAACVLAGCVADEALGRPLAEVLDLRDVDGRPLPVAGDALVEGAVVVPGGRPVPVQLAVARLTPDATGHGGLVVVLRDMTRERQVERMKTEFLSNVSHELRTPLTPIRGYAEILRRRPDLPAEKARTYIDTILESSLRMSRVVDLLVDVAAIEAGRVRPSPQPVQVGALIDERLELWRQRQPERAADLRRRVAAGVPAVSIDREWVGKALDELVDNAVKYTEPGTPVTLVAARDPDDAGRVRLGVRDAGPGLDEDARATLFTDFAQADGSATRAVGGLGLGLSFVRRLADAFGLELLVASEPGRGAEFLLAVPAAERSASRRRPSRRRRPAPADAPVMQKSSLPGS